MSLVTLKMPKIWYLTIIKQLFDTSIKGKTVIILLKLHISTVCDYLKEQN